MSNQAPYSINAEEPRRESLVAPQAQPQIVINNIVHAPQQNKDLSIEDIETNAKRLKITAWVLLIAGAYSTLSCLGMAFHARHLSNLIITGDIKKGFHAEPSVKLPAALDRDEFAFFDIFRNVSMVAFVASAMVLCTGKKALKSIMQQDATFSARVFKCSIFKVVVVALLFVMCAHMSKQGKKHVESFRERYNITFDEFSGHKKIVSDDQDICEEDSYKTETTCNANSICTWCKSAAVGASCNSIESAKGLPSSIFACDKLTFADYEEQEEKSFEKYEKKNHHCCPFKVALFFIYIVHFYFLKKHADSLKSFEDKGGKLEAKECCWSKKEEKKPVNYSAVSTQDFPVATAPSTIPTLSNNMA